jgi:hypothetical protein
LARRVFEACTRRFVASLVLEEAIARPRRRRFIQNYSKLYYFYGRGATPNANRIENPASSRWLVGYSKRARDALLLVWFWGKALQGQGEAVLFKIIVSYTISTAVELRLIPIVLKILQAAFGL